MLAWLGFVATDLGLTLPGEMHQVSSVQAHDVACTYGAMQQLLLWLGLIEVFGAIALSQMCWSESSQRAAAPARRHQRALANSVAVAVLTRVPRSLARSGFRPHPG